jgi:hypothetical protein
MVGMSIVTAFLSATFPTIAVMNKPIVDLTKTA